MYGIKFIKQTVGQHGSEHMWLKIIKYMVKDLPNTKKCKYTWAIIHSTKEAVHEPPKHCVSV
jgi:hypothetical protein